MSLFNKKKLSTSNADTMINKFAFHLEFTVNYKLLLISCNDDIEVNFCITLKDAVLLHLGYIHVFISIIV